MEQVKEHQRDARGFRWLDNWRIDVKLGARMLTKYPGLSIVGGFGLAVGVGISAGFFALVYSRIYATLPVERGERIVALENWDIDVNNEMQPSMHDLLVWQREMKTVADIGAFRTIGRNVIIPGRSAEPIQVAQMTAAGFTVTRVAPVIGRPMVAADETVNAPPVVVIGYDVWQSRFGGDASVIGQELRLGNVIHTIVGVMPEGFAFPVNHQYWIPLKTDTFIVGVVTDLSTNTVDPELVHPVIFHLPNDETRAIALIRVRGNDPLPLSSRLRDLTSALDPTVRLSVVPFSEMKRQATIALRLMVLAVGLIVVSVMLLSAAGIYALMSFTVSQRRTEIGIRAAMGADSRQLLRSIFTKAALQLAAGVAVGFVLALLLDVASEGEMLESFGRAVLPFTTAMMVIVGMLATLGPARRGLRIQPTEALRAE